MADLKPPIREIDILVTTRCNFGCSFCFNEGRGPKKDMGLEDFKALVDGLAERGNFRDVCIGGGEPFLHPRIFDMVQYAVKKLGVNSVSVTTNLSQFPLTVDGARQYLRRLHGAKLNVSIDREHLRFGKRFKQKLVALALASRATGRKIDVIAVARSRKEESQAAPHEIKQLIPVDVLGSVDVRREFFSDKETMRKQLSHWKKTARGIDSTAPLKVRMAYMAVGFLMENPIGADVAFFPDRKAFIMPGPNRSLFFPQLSLGNWMREPVSDILGKNMLFKIGLVNEWLGQGVPQSRKLKGARFARTRVRAIRKEQNFVRSRAK